MQWRTPADLSLHKITGICVKPSDCPIAFISGVLSRRLAWNSLTITWEITSAKSCSHNIFMISYPPCAVKRVRIMKRWVGDGDGIRFYTSLLYAAALPVCERNVCVDFSVETGRYNQSNAAAQSIPAPTIENVCLCGPTFVDVRPLSANSRRLLQSGCWSHTDTVLSNVRLHLSLSVPRTLYVKRTRDRTY